jgi:lipoprotein-anchoring transpeptidase ErfK/SrfK
LPSRPHTEVDMLARRRLLRWCVAVILAPALPVSVAVSQVQPIHRSRRPPLPGLGPSFREEVDYSGGRQPGTVIIDSGSRVLLLVLEGSRAYRYRISVGRDGFGWSGKVAVGAKKEWPEWRPPAEMRARIPELPELVPPGPYNPLGARALYLFEGGRDTLYRIHGTNDPDGVGFDGTSGCFRMTNTDVMDLYDRVAIGAAVVVS